MPEITGIRERRGKALVYLDGEFWAEIDSATVIERGLYERLSLEAEELDEVRAAGERGLAMSRALNYLGHRARSECEVRERLARYGYGERVVEEVVVRLRELGYLDDAEFAREVAREKRRKYGPRRVLGDLYRSGVEEAVAQEVVEEAFAGFSELEAAREAASRRYNGQEGSDAQARRVHGFLMRRGYSAGVCSEVAREYRV